MEHSATPHSYVRAERRRTGARTIRDRDTLYALLDGSLSRSGPGRLAGAPLHVRVLAAGVRLHDKGAPSASLSLLREGLAKAHLAVADGAQQTVALFVPGDALDPEAFVLGHTTAAITAVTPIRIVEIPHSRVREEIERRPDFGIALGRQLARQNALLKEWMASLGRRSAISRTAHLICEISARTSGSDVEAIPFPLTQIELADVLGLSVVHVNRVLQQLRAQGLIDLSRSRLSILNLPRLAQIGDFDRGYLENGDPFPEPRR